MRILIFLPHVTGLSGGADVYLLYLAKALGRDHKVAIITEKNKDAQYEPEEIYARYGLSNIKTYYFRPVFRSGDKNALKSFLWERMTNVQVASLCKRIKPELFINGIENKIIARRYGHTMHIVHFPVPCYQTKLLGWLDKRYIDSYDLLVSNSEFTRYHLKRMYGKDSVILNPPLIFPLIDRNKLAEKRNTILAVGRLIPDKKILEMIAAYRSVARESEIPYDFVIIGNRNHSEDTYYNRIVEAANEPNAPGHVEVHTDVAYEQLLEWYKKAKIFWHAKGYGVTDEHPRDMEHFGMVTVEAMSQGCIPVVIGKAGQLEIMAGELAKLTWQTPDELVAITMELMRDENKIEALQDVVLAEAGKYEYSSFAQKAERIVTDLVADGASAEYGTEIRQHKWPEVEKSEDDKLLTISVAAYNAEKYLEVCLHSLINHKMAPYIEVLVIDDGSKDRTPDIGKEYEKHYPGIVRLISKENGGHGSTINTSIREAKGKYFRVVDADDWVDSQALESLLIKIKDGTYDADLISSNWKYVNIRTKSERCMLQECEVAYGKEYSFDELDVRNVFFDLPSMQMKTSILRQMDITIQEHTFYVDVEYVLFPVPSIQTVLFDEGFIYQYAIGYEEQSVSKANLINHYDHHKRVLKRVIQYEADVEMDAAHRTYYDVVLKTLIETNYRITLIHDADIKRGCMRAKGFDQYLQSVRPDLAVWIGSKLKVVEIARQNNFDPHAIEKSLEYLLFMAKYRSINWIYDTSQYILKSEVFHPIRESRTIRTIGDTDFFVNGLGHGIREKLIRMLR